MSNALFVSVKNATRNYFREFNCIGKRNKKIIVLIMVACFLLGLGISTGFNLLTKSKIGNIPFFPLPAPSPIPPSLSLKTENIKQQVGQNFQVKILADSPSFVLTAADFVITFDPRFLKVVEVKEGNYFQNYPIKKIGENTVQLSGAANVAKNTIIAPRGIGEIGTIIFKPLKATESTYIAFSRSSTVVGSFDKKNVETTRMNDVNIIIK